MGCLSAEMARSCVHCTERRCLLFQPTMSGHHAGARALIAGSKAQAWPVQYCLFQGGPARKGVLLQQKKNKKTLAAGSELELTVPACINKYLRQYQRGGVRFLMRQYANNMGGFLADVSPC